MARVNGGVSAGVFGAPTLKYFTITPQDAANAAVNLTGDVGLPDTALEAIVQTIQTKATTFIIGAIGATSFRVACEPSAWSAADLQAAIRDLGTVNSDDLTGSDVTDFTF
jgi:hypothetical protein